MFAVTIGLDFGVRVIVFFRYVSRFEKALSFFAAF
jgi:hypothetical protein